MLSDFHGGASRPLLGLAALFLPAMLGAAPAAALPPGGDPQLAPQWDKDAQGIFVLDGSVVHNIGELQLNITNWGLIGSLPGTRTTYSEAPSAMWPAGSGVDYLYGAGLWVGAVVNGTPLVSTGYPQTELLPSNRARDTIYRMVEGEPHGLRYPNGDGDDDGDGEIDEDPKDGEDNDRDGQVDEDYAAIGDQHFRCVMRDDTPLSVAKYPDHDPMGLKIIQETHQWTRNELEDAVILDYTIQNAGPRTLEDVWVGLYVDADIGPREGRDATSFDDMIGFLPRYEEDGSLRIVPTEHNGNAWFNMAYMYDCDGDDHLSDGYIGILFISFDRDTRLQGKGSPTTTWISNFQWFAGIRSFDEGGEPTNDTERYTALSRGTIQAVPQSEDCKMANDYRFLVSAPVGWLPPGGELRAQMAIVMGSSLEDLQRNAAEVMVAYFGQWFDRDKDPSTGIRGRERYACETDAGDPPPPPAANPLFRRSVDCPNPDFWFQPNIKQSMLNYEGCIWINGDCEFEEMRGPGLDCWSTRLDSDRYIGCTGVFGREYDVLWYVGSRPPPPPKLRVWPAHDRVHIFWDNSSEHSLDTEFQRPQFEGYRVWRASGWERPAGSSVQTGPNSQLWAAIGEFDMVDSFQVKRELPGGQVHIEWRPLGRNTGLSSIAYTPIVLRPDSWEAAYHRDLRVLLDQIFLEQPWVGPQTPIRYSDAGGVTELGRIYPQLRWWEASYAQIDTLQAHHFGTKWYEFIDRGVKDGFHYFHAVSTTSRMLARRGGKVVVVGMGQEGVPQNNFEPTMPVSTAQTLEERRDKRPQIYVVPNPATRARLEEFSSLHPNAEDPTGLHVEFKNLPRARIVVNIYTLAGDLVISIPHDGTGGDGSVIWNLVSRNGQQVVSGIYLYSVESSDPAFRTFVGRFVLVR